MEKIWLGANWLIYFDILRTITSIMAKNRWVIVSAWLVFDAKVWEFHLCLVKALFKTKIWKKNKEKLKERVKSFDINRDNFKKKSSGISEKNFFETPILWARYELGDFSGKHKPKYQKKFDLSQFLLAQRTSDFEEGFREKLKNWPFELFKFCNGRLPDRYDNALLLYTQGQDLCSARLTVQMINLKRKDTCSANCHSAVHTSITLNWQIVKCLEKWESRLPK